MIWHVPWRISIVKGECLVLHGVLARIYLFPNIQCLLLSFCARVLHRDIKPAVSIRDDLLMPRSAYAHDTFPNVSCSPQNIGFDIRGDIKIFDFGLAKELKPSEREGQDAYKTSGLVGTRRYMVSFRFCSALLSTS